MALKSPYISVIIPVYNGGRFLEECLDAVFRSSFQSFEILVVDDASTDKSAEIARQKDVLVLSMPKQSGPAAARNLAAESARGEILMFVDADVVLNIDTLARVAKRFETQPEISALFGSYDDAPAEPNFLSQYKNLQHHFVHQTSNSAASTFWSGLGAIRKDVFLDFGGFDQNKFSIPSIEDIDLGFRLKRDGLNILLDREIQAKHLKRWDLGSHLRTEIFARALPWSKLIIAEKGMINDMNLKSTDRLSAVLTGLSLIMLPLVLWKPIALLVPFGLLGFVVFLNRRIFRFFIAKRGIFFAIAAIPFQFLYFFYSGSVFVLCWLYYKLPLFHRSPSETYLGA